MDWIKKIDDWVRGGNPSPTDREHVAMGVSRPKYVDGYLEGLTGPNEQHNVDQNSHCLNPKCGQQFDDSMLNSDGTVQCPSCGFQQNVLGEVEQAWRPGETGKPELNPGGITRSGLTLGDMGQIGEQVVLRLGELPGIGAVQPASGDYNFPIDAIIVSQRGKFGVEIKTNHSQAQERFKIGGKQERHEKITYCLTHGMKPALVGVRLNFYTDKAYVFWREGLTDTWIGNSKMQHVGTYDFSDLNPFKSPDPQAQALAVDNAHLQDQSEEPDADLDAVLGQKVAFEEAEHERDDKGKFTVKHDEHEVKIHDDKGKHTHNVKRCRHCGAANYVPHGTHGRVECSTCGEDPERVLHVAKVVLSRGREADLYAKEAGWGFRGRNGMGHRVYDNTDDQGIYHQVIIGQGNTRRNDDLDAKFLKQRMSRCQQGKCMHGPKDSPITPMDEPLAPVLKAGQQVDGHLILEIDGGLALVQNLQTGTEDVLPAEHLLNRERMTARREP